MSEWVIAIRVRKCLSCASPIIEGEPYGVLTVARHPACAACMKRMMGEDAPANVFDATPPTDLLPANVRAAAGHGFVRASALPRPAGVDRKIQQIPEGDR